MNTHRPAAQVLSRQPWQGSPVLDAHVHLGPYNRFFIEDPSGAAMLRVMDRCGVTGGIVSSMLGVELDASAGNQETAQLCETYPDRFAGYIVVNPWQDPERQLSHWHEHPAFVGVKVHPDLHEYPLDGPRYEPVWDYARQTSRPVLTHTWAGSAYNDLAHVDRIADRNPQVWILAGHAGVAPGSFDRAVDVAQRHSRVLLELCGSHNHGRHIANIVQAVGASQVVFGSDLPFIDLRMSLGRFVFAQLAADDLTAVLGQTMRDVLSCSAAGAAFLDRLHLAQAD